MNRLSHATSVLAFGFVLGFGGTASAAPFQNGSFEIGTLTVDPCNVALNAADTSITGWTVSVGNIEYVTNGCWIAIDGTRSLDLVGNGSIGGIQQTFDTVAGAKYQVAFNLAGNPSPSFPPAVKPLTVTVSGITTKNYTFDTTGKTVASMGWVTKSFAFTANAPTTTIDFVSNVAPSTFAGAALDNVQILPLNPWTLGPFNVINGFTGLPVSSLQPVVNDGVTGLNQTADFTYQTSPSNDYCCHTGDWRFETTATADGDYRMNWVYSGYHGTCGAQAVLTGYYIRGGVEHPLPVSYQATDTCPPGGSEPSGGFAAHGQVFLGGLQNGDIYGFKMHATNNDSNGAVGGWLSVSRGTEGVNVSMQASPNPYYYPGPLPAATPITITATVTDPVDPSRTPTGHVTFTQEGRLIGGCQAIALVGNQATCSLPNFFAPPLSNFRAIGAFYSGDSVFLSAVGGVILNYTAVPPVVTPAPTLLRSVAITSPAVQAFVVGRAESLGSTSITVDAFAATSCGPGGALNSPTSLGSFVVPSTNPEGYFAVSIPGVNPGAFVALQVTAPSSSPISTCIANSGDNDYWPKALDLDPLPSFAAADWIDAPGKARWYRFSVAPGQKLSIALSGTPDYDIVVFKDIQAAFDRALNQIITDATGLNKLNAEFAPSTFSPSTFSPSTFSPSTFSPDAYAPSTFSPSTFSSSLFSPSTFSPSTFSPSTFSPSTFSPSTFSPSTFSPSTFSPSTFSPSTFSPSTFSALSLFQFDPLDIQKAFSSAQTSSIIGVSATPYSGSELVVVNSWNEIGNFYVRVAARGDTFSTSEPFTVNVVKGATTCTNVAPLLPLTRSAAAGPNVKTVILLDSTKLALNTLVGGVTLQSKLDAFKARAEIGGVIVDVNADTRVQQLKAQADLHKDCPYATNLVAEEIKAIVDTYRANNAGLRYVVIIGNDGAIPFFRYPDETLIGQESNYEPPVTSGTISDASLTNDFVLSQDAYGAKTRISMRSILFPVPGLAVGRLIETPAEIAGLIDAYTAAGGAIVPSSSLVTGYDFLADVANAVRSELNSGIGVAPQTLLTPNGISPQDPASWTATQLGSALFGSRKDIIFLAGHFSANSALAADFTTSLLTTDLAASSTNFTNSIVFSAGCHAGYNIVDADAIPGVTVKLDWAQAFAQKRATLIAGTGYQYGDTDFIEYSERLYKNFARQLRAGTVGVPVSVGEALARAKLDYIAVTPDLRGIHQKAVLEATVFGLPMLGVNMPIRDPNLSSDGDVAPALATPATSVGAQAGLRIADLPVTPSLSPGGTCLKNPPFDTGVAGTPILPCPSGYTTATWLYGPDGVVSNPAEPVLPLQVLNVGVAPTTAAAYPNIALRGVGFFGGSYTDTFGIVPLTGAPTTELRGVHTSFSSPYFFPMRLSTTNYFAALAGVGGTRLLVTPAQHRADDLTLGTSVLRKYTGLNLRLYYSDVTTANALAAPPTIASTGATSSGGNVKFTAKVLGSPTAGIHEVWVTYTPTALPNTWGSLQLTQCGAPAPSICGTTTDTQIWMGELPSAPANIKYIVQAVNGVGLVSLDDNLGAYYSAYGGVAPSPAAATTLALVSPPTSIVYGEAPSVTASLNSTSGPLGNAVVSISAGGTSSTLTTGAGGMGTTTLAKVAPGQYQLVASYAGNASYLPSTASSALTVTPAPTAFVDDSSSVGPAVFLRAAVNGVPQLQRPLSQELVTFAISQGATLVQTVAVRTDLNGRAAISPPVLPVGTYTVIATFAGSELYLGTTLQLANLPVTAPCPSGDVTKVRWHYSASGSPGNWTLDTQRSCADGSVSFPTQATEGILTLASGTPLKFGLAVQLPNNKTHNSVTVLNGKAVFPVSCVSGLPPSASTFTLTLAPTTVVLVQAKSWNPTSAKGDAAGFQGAGTVPALCGTGQVRIHGGSFSANVTLN